MLAKRVSQAVLLTALLAAVALAEPGEAGAYSWRKVAVDAAGEMGHPISLAVDASRDPAISSGAMTAAQAPTLKIGALLPLSGELGWIGPGLLKAAQLAAKHVNDAGGVLGGQVQILQGDTQTDPDVGVAEALRLIDTEGVTVIVGAAASGVTVPVAENATVPRGVLQISPSSSSPAITTLADNDLLFRTTLSDSVQGRVLAKLARERGYQTASTLYLNNPYGEGISDIFAEELETRGGELLAAVPHELGQPSYLTELQAATAGNPDVLAAISYPNEAIVYLTEAIQNGLINQFLFVDGTKSQDIIDAVCTAVGAGCLDGMYGTAQGWLDTPAALAFDAAYEAEYGEPPPIYARATYDAVILAALAAEAAGSSDSSLIRDALRGVAGPGGEVVGLADGGIGHALDVVGLGQDVNYEGASGCVDLDVNGDVTCGAMEIWRIENDTIVTVRIDPVWPLAVGGIAELPSLARTPSDERTAIAEGSGSSAASYAALAAGVAGAVAAIGAGAWYARRRWQR